MADLNQLSFELEEKERELREQREISSRLADLLERRERKLIELEESKNKKIQELEASVESLRNNDDLTLLELTNQALEAKITNLELENDRLKLIQVPDLELQISELKYANDILRSMANQRSAKRTSELESQVSELQYANDILRAMANQGTGSGRINTLPTPPATPASATTPAPPTNSQGERRKQPQNGSSSRKRRKFVPSPNQTHCIVENLTFRSQGPMLHIKWDLNEEKALEYHAEDIVDSPFKDKITEFLKKLKEKNSPKINTIRRNDIRCLIDLL